MNSTPSLGRVVGEGSLPIPRYCGIDDVNYPAFATGNIRANSVIAKLRFTRLRHVGGTLDREGSATYIHTIVTEIVSCPRNIRSRRVERPPDATAAAVE